MLPLMVHDLKEINLVSKNVEFGQRGVNKANLADGCCHPYDVCLSACLSVLPFKRY